MVTSDLRAAQPDTPRELGMVSWLLTIPGLHPTDLPHMQRMAHGVALKAEGQRREAADTFLRVRRTAPPANSKP